MKQINTFYLLFFHYHASESVTWASIQHHKTDAKVQRISGLRKDIDRSEPHAGTRDPGE